MANISLFRKKEIKRKLITDFIYSYITKSKRGHAYKRSYRNLIWHIQHFQDKTGLLLYTDSFTEHITEEFIDHLKQPESRRKGKSNLGLMSNTIDFIFYKLKHVLRKAKECGYPVNFGFENIETTREDANAVYLTIDELNRINELKCLSKEARAVRDRFLLGCYTALRFSDYSKITTENIIGNNIVLKTRKTGANVVIPIHPVIRQVLDRNNGEFPPLPSQQAFGATIKRVCRKAGINSEVLYERTVGIKVIRKRVKKYSLISSHTARRTGATNMYLAGIPTFRIMLITGHVAEQSFFRYIRIEKEENARTLADHPFFK